MLPGRRHIRMPPTAKALLNTLYQFLSYVSLPNLVWSQDNCKCQAYPASYTAFTLYSTPFTKPNCCSTWHARCPQTEHTSLIHQAKRQDKSTQWSSSSGLLPPTLYLTVPHYVTQILLVKIVQPDLKINSSRGVVAGGHQTENCDLLHTILSSQKQDSGKRWVLHACHCGRKSNFIMEPKHLH